jgi:tRNA-specific 2-thiouridylase
VLDEKGKVIGSHDGVVFLTLGERHGFTITKHTTDNKPLYVIAKDIEKNTVTVSTRSVSSKDYHGNTLTLEDFHVITSGSFNENLTYDAQVRYHGEYHSCDVLRLDQHTVQLRFHKETPLVSPGQSVVLYLGTQCIGGGVVAGPF